ncbi:MULTISPECIES: hypothetical protein [unclassified Mesorhizobium]|uniref:hypothetical protein n=1 Tax=unclassified Mesorhizobium TaxID=325217 RepID=UPI0013E295C6|nr:MULTISPECIES: hypothetical protein [unclassified Mesorhizobium]
MISAAGCSIAIAFKPSLFQAFFRAECEVFRLFQRFPRGANSELPESRETAFFPGADW